MYQKSREILYLRKSEDGQEQYTDTIKGHKKLSKRERGTERGEREKGIYRDREEERAREKRG